MDGPAFKFGVVVLSLLLLASVECNSLIRGDQLRTFLVAVPAGKLRTFLGCSRQDVGPAKFAIRTGDAYKAVTNGGQTVDRHIFRSGHVQFFQHGVGADAIKGGILAEIQTGDLSVTYIHFPELHMGRHINFAQGIPVAEQVKQSCVVAEIQSGQLVIAAIQGRQNYVAAEIQTGELIVLALQVLQVDVLAEIQLREAGIVAVEVLQRL